MKRHSFSVAAHRRLTRCRPGAAVLQPLESLEQRVLPSVSVLTGHNDNARTGLNAAESTLTLANVNAGSFGLQFLDAVDGQVYAQPLYLAGVAIPGLGVRNVLFVATEHDSVYAFDADGGGAPLWHTSFINPAAGITPFSTADAFGCAQITPEIGITGTPVIDPASGTLYVVAQTKEISGSVVNYVQRLHALNVATGADKVPPAVIAASVPGTGDNVSSVTFVARDYKERAALLLSNGVIFTSWASHCDVTPAHGWILGYNAQSLQQVSAFNSSPNGQLATFWSSNAGPAADSAGNIFTISGNGTFDTSPTAMNPRVDYGDSILRINPNGTTVGDFFTPLNQAALDAIDQDLGSGGVMLLPDSVGSTAHPHLLVASGKQGVIYLIDQGNMGQYHPSGDQVAQELTLQGTNNPIGPEFGAPAYFNNAVYYQGIDDVLKAFRISNGMLSTSPVSQSSTVFAYPGSTPSISSNGTANGIVWVIENGSSGQAVLHAYDASNLAHELYNSNQAGTRDLFGDAVKFTTPTIINGKVYVGTANGLAAFGILAPHVPPPLPVTSFIRYNDGSLWEHFGTAPAQVDVNLFPIDDNTVSFSVGRDSQGNAAVFILYNNGQIFEWSPLVGFNFLDSVPDPFASELSASKARADTLFFLRSTDHAVFEHVGTAPGGSLFIDANASDVAAGLDAAGNSAAFIRYDIGVPNELFEWSPASGFHFIDTNVVSYSPSQRAADTVFIVYDNSAVYRHQGLGNGASTFSFIDANAQEVKAGQDSADLGTAHPSVFIRYRSNIVDEWSPVTGFSPIDQNIVDLSASENQVDTVFVLYNSTAAFEVIGKNPQDFFQFVDANVASIQSA